MKNDLFADCGDTFILTQGAYSDYHIIGVFRALQPILRGNIEEWLAAIQTRKEEEEEKLGFSDLDPMSALASELILNELAEELHCKTVHSDGYSFSSVEFS